GEAGNDNEVSRLRCRLREDACEGHKKIEVNMSFATFAIDQPAVAVAREDDSRHPVGSVCIRLGIDCKYMDHVVTIAHLSLSLDYVSDGFCVGGIKPEAFSEIVDSTVVG